MKLLFLLLLIAGTSCLSLNYRKGDSFSSAFSSSIANNGESDSTKKDVKQKITANVVFTCTEVSETSFTFRMDVSNAAFFVEDTAVSYEDPDVPTLGGQPFYFSTTPAGVIQYVLYDEDDEFVAIKKGIVSTLATDLAGAQLKESDAIGVHLSHYHKASSSNGNVVIAKGFTERDFDAFPDPAVKPSDVKLSGMGRVEVDSRGKIVSATVQHSVLVWGAKSKNDGNETFVLRLSASGINTLANIKIATSPVPVADMPANLKKDDLVVKLAPGVVPPKATPRPPMVRADPYPYNKDFKFDRMFGSKSCGISFDAEVMVGTNFDCEHEYFNYKALAQAEAKVYLFDDEHSLALAKFEYGKQDGRPLSDEVLVTLWDDVIYRYPIPELTYCQRHTQNIFKKSAGFAVTKTIFVSVVPVTFRTGADGQVRVDWDWELCDSTLLADVDILPSVEVTLSAGVETNLVVVKAGISLDVFLNQAIRPEAYLKGTLCTIGFKVAREQKPLTVALDAYYATRKCHIFKCEWANKKTYPIWSWGLPAQTEVLFEKDFDIRHL